MSRSDLQAVAVLATSLSLGAPAAWAQTAVLEEVIVSAQKRDTTVLDTPTTVNVIGPEALTDFRINDLQSINRLVPGYQFEMGAGSNMTLSIRGIGTTSSAQSFEQSVAPYIDGIYLGGNNRDFSWPLFDLERIEVLKGTQSGIAGQNTSVGVVSLVTQKPGNTVAGYLTAGVELENDGYSAEGAIDVPMSKTLRTRFSGYFNQRGGWIDNVRTGHELGENETYAGRINTVWDVTDNTSVRLFAEYDHLRQIGSAPSVIYRDSTGAYAQYVSPYFDWSPEISRTVLFGNNPTPNVGIGYGGDSGVLSDSLKGAITLDIELGGGHRLTSITAASQIDDKLSVDQDTSQADIPSASDPTPSQWLSQTSDYQQFTEELRLTSPSEQRLSYIVGLWYRNAEQKKTTNIVFFTAAQNGISWPFKQTTDNYSAFGDLNFKLTDQFSLGGTLRYTHEEKDGEVQGNTVFAPNPAFPAFALFESSLSDDFVDGSVRLQYEPSNTTTWYALYSHGTKTGALVDLVASGRPQVVKPEVVETVELGWKSEWFERTLALNLSVFQMDITDYQDSFTASVNGQLLFVASNTDVTSTGADAQLAWRPTERLKFGATAEYLDAENDTVGGTFVRSPKWQFGGDARFTFPLGSLEGAVFANVLYKDDYYNFPFGQPARVLAITPAYTTADIGMSVDAERWNVSVLCKNCTDEYAKVRAQSASFGPTRAAAQFAFIPELRTVMLRATYNF